MTTEIVAPEAQSQVMPELSALYGEWKRLEQIAIFNGDDDAPWQAAWNAEDRFWEVPSRSPADVLFKLRVGCLYDLDGSENAAHLRAAMRDLQRMAGDLFEKPTVIKGH